MGENDVCVAPDSLGAVPFPGRGLAEAKEIDFDAKELNFENGDDGWFWQEGNAQAEDVGENSLDGLCDSQMASTASTFDDVVAGQEFDGVEEFDVDPDAENEELHWRGGDPLIDAVDTHDTVEDKPTESERPERVAKLLEAAEQRDAEKRREEQEALEMNSLLEFEHLADEAAELERLIAEAEGTGDAAEVMDDAADGRFDLVV